MSKEEPTAAGPYKGLAPFGDSEHDALLFFGREREREIVVANLIAARLTVLYGPSGVGKSSLLRAGVARALRGLPERPIVVVFSSWTENPAVALAGAVCASAGIAPAESLRDAVAAVGERDVYLILDQAEEYFLYHGEGQQAFEDDLVFAVTELVRVNVLLSLREDALAKLDRFKGRIPNLFGNSLRLDRLDREAGRSAIVRPVERWNELEGTEIEVEQSLVEAVLDDVGAGQIEQGLGGLGAVEGDGRPGGIEAPYLQLVMQRLWEVECREGTGRLRQQTLSDLGGADTIVAEHLEHAVDQLRPFEKHIAAELSRYLVTPSGTKIAHTLSDLAGYAGVEESDLEPVAAELAERRILRSLDSDEGVRYEIFHDVLAGAMLAWRTHYVADRTLERERAASKKRHRRLVVLAGATLAALGAMVAVTVYALVERRDARAQAILAHARELDATALTRLPLDPELGLLLAVEAARTAPSRQVEGVVRDALVASRVRWVVRAGAPIVAATFSSDGRRILVASADGKARVYLAGTRRLLRTLDHGGPIRASAFSQDARLVVTAGQDGIARIWDVGRGQLAQSVAHGAPILGASFSRDGSLLVTSGGHAAKLWRVGRGGLKRALRTTKPVIGAQFSPARSLVAVIARDSRVRVFQLLGGKPITLDHGSRLAAVAFSADGRLLATAGQGHVAQIWHLSSRRRVHELRGHVGALTAVVFGSHGARIATASHDGTARVWDVSTGTPVSQLVGHTNPVVAVDFSLDGLFLATASTDNTAAVWKADTGGRVALLAGDSGAVRTVAFSPDAEFALTASDDGTARLWDTGTKPALVPVDREAPMPPSTAARSADGETAVATGDVVQLSGPLGSRTLVGHHDVVNSVAFSPDGTLIVTASRDHDARVWDVRTGVSLHQLHKHFGSVVDARYSPDGRWIVTGGPQTAGLWTSAGEFVGYLRGPTTLLTAAAFLPDSRTVITAERGGTVRAYRCLICGTIPELVRLAEQRLAATGRTLTAEERRRYLG